jgi:hypothetical protein
MSKQLAVAIILAIAAAIMTHIIENWVTKK